MNVTGQEVATGIADPLNMFVAFGGIIIIGGAIWVIWQIFNN